MSNTLHFKGDVSQIDTNQTVGPDRFGAYYTPVSAEFDGEVTTVKYRPLPPVELGERQAAAWDYRSRYNWVSRHFKLPLHPNRAPRYV